MENLFTLDYLFYDNEDGAEILQTYKFKSMEDYVAWMNAKIEREEKKTEEIEEEEDKEVQNEKEKEDGKQEMSEEKDWDKSDNKEEGGIEEE